MLCNCHHYLVPEHFHHPGKKPHTHQQSLLTPHSPRPLGTSISFQSSWICRFWMFPINGIIQDLPCCVWLISFNIMCSRFAFYFCMLCVIRVGGFTQEASFWKFLLLLTVRCPQSHAESRCQASGLRDVLFCDIAARRGVCPTRVI